jgi:hypothetical protein
MNWQPYKRKWRRTVMKQSNDEMLTIATMRITGVKQNGVVYLSRPELIGWLAECELETTDTKAKRTIRELRNYLKGSYEEEV